MIQIFIKNIYKNFLSCNQEINYQNNMPIYPNQAYNMLPNPNTPTFNPKPKFDIGLISIALDKSMKHNLIFSILVGFFILFIIYILIRTQLLHYIENNYNMYFLTNHYWIEIIICILYIINCTFIIYNSFNIHNAVAKYIHQNGDKTSLYIKNVIKCYNNLLINQNNYIINIILYIALFAMLIMYTTIYNASNTSIKSQLLQELIKNKDHPYNKIIIWSLFILQILLLIKNQLSLTKINCDLESVYANPNNIANEATLQVDFYSNGTRTIIELY